MRVAILMMLALFVLSGCASQFSQTASPDGSGVDAGIGRTPDASGAEAGIAVGEPPPGRGTDAVVGMSPAVQALLEQMEQKEVASLILDPGFVIHQGNLQEKQSRGEWYSRGVHVLTSSVKFN